MNESGGHLDLEAFLIVAFVVVMDPGGRMQTPTTDGAPLQRDGSVKFPAGNQSLTRAQTIDATKLHGQHH